jgi:hypothetical protein
MGGVGVGSCHRQHPVTQITSPVGLERSNAFITYFIFFNIYIYIYSIIKNKDIKVSVFGTIKQKKVSAFFSIEKM